METGKRMMMSPSNEKLDKLLDSKLSPNKNKNANRRKSTMSHLTGANDKKNKVVIENDPVRVKIPDINDA